MNVPDWIWQGLALWATGKGLEWALQHHHEVANRLRDLPYLISNPGAKGFNEKATLTVVATARIRTTYNPYDGEWITSRIPFE